MSSIILSIYTLEFLLNILNKMALTNSVQIICLAACIGEDGDYYAFNRKCPTTGRPSDTISTCISIIEQNAARILFADTCERVIGLIEGHHDKKIIFISPASLGQQKISFIRTNYPSVDRFYIFSEKPTDYAEFGACDRSFLQMFDQETDLFIQLAYDLSSDIIKQGEKYLENNDAENALKYFEYSLILNMKANEINNNTCLTYLKQLNGDGNNIGLIQQAKDMLTQQQQTKEEKLSQEESQEYYH